MKLYTKTGDEGQTSLIGGSRVPKHHIRIESYGTVDELNSYIGLIRSVPIDASYIDALVAIQNHLFDIGALLASEPGKSKMKLRDITTAEIDFLENLIDHYELEVPALRNFILPGGSTIISFCHIARCVCRRAERLVVELAESSTVDQLIIIYLNRLSDFLFVLARKLTQDEGIEEVLWKS